MLNNINNISNLFRKNIQQSSPSPLSGTSMDWYKNQNANNSALVPGFDPFKVNGMFNKPLHKSIGNPTGFSLQDNPLSKSLASSKTDFLGGLKNINGRIGDFAKGAGLSTGSMIDMGAGVVDSVAGAVGLKGAEVSTGMDTTIDTISSLPLELIPGVGTVLKGGMKALSLINKYGGKKSKQQGTDYGLATLGYDKEFNPLADKKYGLFSRKSRKRANKLTARQDKSNLMKSVPGFNETQNMYASQNAIQHTAEKNYQQLHGDTNLGLLTARLGTKMPPVNFRNIADRAVQNVKKNSKKAETFEEYKNRIGKLNPNLIKEDSTYNLKGAFEGGLEPELHEDGTYHLGSRNPKTGELLKTPNHETWDLLVEAEEKEGYAIYIKDGKFYSAPKEKVSSLDQSNARLAISKYKKEKHKEGGLLTKKDKEEVIEEVVEDKKNVIPEGAFHSRLNKYGEGIAEHVTRKGIPVITKDEKGKVIQHAEVERNEIIFHKEATDTIETLYKKYEEAESQKLKDEIAIECGKYVADQILINTDDRTGIIETIEYA